MFLFCFVDFKSSSLFYKYYFAFPLSVFRFSLKVDYGNPFFGGFQEIIFSTSAFRQGGSWDYYFLFNKSCFPLFAFLYVEYGIRKSLIHNKSFIFVYDFRFPLKVGCGSRKSHFFALFCFLIFPFSAFHLCRL